MVYIALFAGLDSAHLYLCFVCMSQYDGQMYFYRFVFKL